MLWTGDNHTDNQYHQHVFQKPIFSLHFWPMEGTVLSDSFHFSDVPKTFEQLHQPAAGVPKRSMINIMYMFGDINHEITQTE
jgi:hypothetical protein